MDLFDPPEKLEKFCPTCGASTTEYRHKLSKGLVKGLIRLALNDGQANLQRIGLNANQYTNFYKLRYWNLTKQLHEDGKWFITEAGYQFLCGTLSAPVRVWSYRGDFIRAEEELTTIHDLVDDTYWQHEDYIAMRQPHL